MLSAEVALHSVFERSSLARIDQFAGFTVKQIDTVIIGQFFNLFCYPLHTSLAGS